MLGTLVKERQRTQNCCWRTRPGTQMAQIPSNIQDFLEIPEEAGTLLHFPRTETTRTFCGTSVNSLRILDVVEPNQFQPLRPAPQPVLSVPDSGIFCVCPSPNLDLRRSLMELNTRNTEACWVEPWLFLWPFCWERPESERSAEPWRPLVDHSWKGRTLNENKRLEF